jgi:hypothetical protein
MLVFLLPHQGTEPSPCHSLDISWGLLTALMLEGPANVLRCLLTFTIPTCSSFGFSNLGPFPSLLTGVLPNPVQITWTKGFFPVSWLMIPRPCQIWHLDYALCLPLVATARGALPGTRSAQVCQVLWSQLESLPYLWMMVPGWHPSVPRLLLQLITPGNFSLPLEQSVYQLIGINWAPGEGANLEDGDKEGM